MKVKHIFSICLVCLFLYSCNQSQNNNKPSISLIKPVVNFSVKDSLNKYVNADSVLLVDDSLGTVLFVGKANNVSFGIYAMPDRILKIYQNLKGHWELADSFTYNLGFSFVDIIDLNGDKLKDIKISTLSGTSGNTENFVFLYNPKNKSFTHNKYYDLTNVEYDTANHFIRSSWYAGIVHCQTKCKFKIVGDSLRMTDRASYCPDEKRPEKYGYLEVTIIHNGKEKAEKFKGNPEKIWAKFEQMFWDSSL